MAINLDAIREKLQKLQSQQGGGKSKDLWKPEAGKTVIRIVPYQHNKDNPFLELYFHYKISKKKSLLSPITYGGADPIVTFAEQLKKTGSKEDWKLGRSLEPKLRTYVPVIVRGKEEEGVKFWGFGKEIYQELLAIIADPDYGDITDLKNGRDITVEFTSAADAGNDYGKLTIRVRPNITPVTDSKDILKLITEKQPNIEDMYKPATKEELKAALEAFLNPTTDEEETDEETKPVTTDTEEDEEETPPAKPAKNPGAKSVTSAKKSFEDLFNK